MDVDVLTTGGRSCDGFHNFEREKFQNSSRPGIRGDLPSPAYNL